MATPPAASGTADAPRIYYARSGLPAVGAGPGRTARDLLLAGLRHEGFTAVLVPAPWLCPPGARSLAPLDADLAPAPDGGTEPLQARLARDARSAAEHGLGLLLRLELQRVARDAHEATAPGAWYRDPVDDPARDPRLPLSEHGVRQLREGPPAGFIAAWAARLERWTRSGVGGYVVQAPPMLDAASWRALFGPSRQANGALCCLAWAPGLGTAALARLHGAGFDGVFSSLPWWDYRAPWLAEELDRLRAVAPVIAPACALDSDAAGDAPAGPADARRGWAAAFSGAGWLAGEAARAAGAERVNAWLQDAHVAGPARIVVGRDGGATLLLRDAAADGAALLALNPDEHASARVDWNLAAGLLPAGEIRPRDESGSGETLAPASCARYDLAATPPVRAAPRAAAPRSESGAQARVAIEQVEPAVDGGFYPVKGRVHDPVRVRADIFMDGHDRLAAELRWRADDEPAWRSVPLRQAGNDRWEAAFRPCRIGPHAFQIAAWYDAWETFRHELEVKHTAGVGLRLEREEGLQLLRDADQRASQGATPGPGAGLIKRALKLCAAREAGAEPDAAQVEMLLSPALAQAMRAHDDRPFESLSAVYPVWVDRAQAVHAAWYELFPRSQATEPGRHGTFDDVIARLPDIREMGFDVLYLPPIHPIGLANRKGRNNSLRAEPGDVGSPYAIGSPAGGHDAIEPRLGTLADFLRLVKAARVHGLEMALDFAIQCSPDHPWLAQHPDWFSWRPDGSLRYAENPPKKYQDIVNVSFYGPAPKRARKLGLWRALRDIVLFWTEHGVRTFRVDNPHTKPLPFWQWLIAEVRARHPDVLFLSEAFTRPKMMYRLAKIGFTQSYTYFTWRNDKAELKAYLHEISHAPPADFFRPHFFVNTPDINPLFLQTSGRPGFLIRAALAALGSGLWGVYSGFELCEAAPVPGKEEYLDSEKYELRQRDWRQPGNIRAEIARLNQLRRANPALQSHRGLTLAASGNDRVIAFAKATPGNGNVILAAISLDPFHPQTAYPEPPFALFAPPWPASLVAEDLLAGGRETWHGGAPAVALSPDQPYRIWRLSRHG
ncbi:alpha-1,4-glucan--maltose-1-phosphate maltosyltransferase [Achromobacter xylosoxidans]|uniref:alpha-1,4-glucan--maltose-1-phosphate maltosyltransferase n=1 Tax=Alcaligenes xylosoxydans xylosoxydans TaxID=85698 RepID=UPI001F13DAF6|nr:alpha-1,4-glucan--maltose-1-phosphate maltosyltransferase [Achromobacter xylosoxidans]